MTLQAAPISVRRRPPPPLTVIAAIAIGIAILGGIGLTVSMLVAGVLFVACFLALCLVKPEVATIVVLGTAPLLWDVGGGPVKMAIAEIALLIALGASVLTGRLRRVPNPLRWPILCYFGVCVISFLINGAVPGTTATLLQMALYMVAAVLYFSAGTRDSRQVVPSLYALVAGSVLLVGLLVAAGSNYAFGIHKNNLGSSIGMGLVTAIGLWMGETNRMRLRLLTVAIVVLLVGLVLSLSRGSWMGASAGTLVIYILRRQWRFAFKMIALMVPIIAFVWVLLPSASTEYVTAIGTEAYNTKARIKSLEYGWEHFKRSPIVGVGPGLRKTYDATNLIMTALAETGVLGLLSFVSIFVAFALMVWRAARRLDPHDPLMVLLTVGAALMTDKLVHGMVDHYWVRGILPVWAGAGIAIYASHQSRIARPESGSAIG